MWFLSRRETAAHGPGRAKSVVGAGLLTVPVGCELPVLPPLRVVYIGSSDTDVYGLNATTGAELWSFTTGGVIQSSPAVADGVLYIGSEDNHVYALNATTGLPLWSFTAGFVVDSPPAVVNGVLYIGSHDGNVYAFH